VKKMPRKRLSAMKKVKKKEDKETNGDPENWM
jgi:hypothetical protein